MSCNKDIVALTLRVISDAHNLSIYYAELLLKDVLPVVLEDYKNYNKETELYFNVNRMVKRDEIGMSFYDFYNKIAYLRYMYEYPLNNESMRRKIIMDVFNKSYIIQRLLIEDLYKICS